VLSSRLKSSKGVLGILVSESQANAPSLLYAPSTLPEDGFCRELCTLGKQLGLLVYAFRASDLQVAAGTVTGFVPTPSGWERTQCPLPQLIYDRSMNKCSREKRIRSLALTELKSRSTFILLNSPLPGKLEVYEAMQEHAQLRPWLPPTYRYTDSHSLVRLAAVNPAGLFMKPSAGCQGRGTLRMAQSGNKWTISGRASSNKPLDRSFHTLHDCTLWIERFAGSATFIIQPYLQLTDRSGAAFDIRSLIQKDERGNWSLTGIALREGAAGSTTANLHGGGSASDASNALLLRYGQEKANNLLRQIRQISLSAAELLEQRYGRLCELGLDFGIDQNEQIWFLEANSKPGRQAMQEIPGAAHLAVIRPLQYALLQIESRQPSLKASSPNLASRIQRRSNQEVHP